MKGRRKWRSAREGSVWKAAHRAHSADWRIGRVAQGCQEGGETVLQLCERLVASKLSTAMNDCLTVGSIGLTSTIVCLPAVVVCELCWLFALSRQVNCCVGTAVILDVYTRRDVASESS